MGEDNNMTVYIDADGCPVVTETENICKRYNIPLIIMCDTNHIFNSEYARVITVGAGTDAVDFALINRCNKGDIVVTQDYGVAAMALSKKCHCINQNGILYTENNIEALLNSRYITKKIRNSSNKHHLKGPTKRTKEDNKNFTQAFEQLIKNKATGN